MTGDILVPYYITLAFFFEIEFDLQHLRLFFKRLPPVVHTKILAYLVRLNNCFGDFNPKLMCPLIIMGFEII